MASIVSQIVLVLVNRDLSDGPVKSLSMASELLQNLDRFPYKTNIDDFGEDIHIDPEDLKRLRTSIHDKFWVDTCPFQTRRGNIIPAGIFSIFGKYNNTPPETVKNELHDWVEDRRNEYTLLLGNLLRDKKWTFGTWCVNLKLRSKPADAGALYCINRMCHGCCSWSRVLRRVAHRWTDGNQLAGADLGQLVRV